LSNRMSYPMRSLHTKTRPAPYMSNDTYKIKQIPQLKETLSGNLPRMLLRNLPKDCTQSELIPLIPVSPAEIKAIEFLKKVDNTQVGACVVEFANYESLTKAIAMDGRDLRGMQIWSVKDVDGIRTLSLLKNLGHKNKPKPDKSNGPFLTEATLKNVDMSTLNHIKDALNSISKVNAAPTPSDDVKQRSVKVRNLPRTASTVRLQQIFLGCGSIEHITAQNHKGEVIIRFSTSDEADLAVRFYNGRRMDGKRLQVLYRDR